MHPALSIIVFTTLSGLGYGLAAMLGLGLVDPQPLAGRLAYPAAFILIGAGLLSSTGHLLNRQRAWRALSQWRSSWLSREGVLALLGFGPLVVLSWYAVFEGRHQATWGLVVVAMSGLTVYATAMIYASLRSVQAWNTKLTPACYLLFAAAGGLLFATAFGRASGETSLLMPLAAAATLLAAWAAKLAWRNRMQTTRPLSTPETATGLGGIGKVRLFERPHTNENYLTREMGFRIARKHASKLFRIAFLLGGLLPFVAMLVLVFMPAGTVGVVLAGGAVLVHLVGMLTERWLFFAEARHAVMNYY